MVFPSLARGRTRFHEVRLRLERHVSRGVWRGRLWELALFGFKQGWACLFGGLLLALVLATRLWWPAHAPLARYDFLFLAALTMQVLLLVLRMETVREAKVILMFHVIGTAMELFKTAHGSWMYPEPCRIRLGGVPLFSGFMYASVGSYLARITRILDMRYTHFPRAGVRLALAAAIYANFFTDSYGYDLRWPLFALVAASFGRTRVHYLPYRKWRRMPLLLGFVLVALFIWGAENIGTFATVWVYPHQQQTWQMVHAEKLGSWLLLMIVSFILVSLAHPPQGPEGQGLDGGVPAGGVPGSPGGMG